MSTMMDRFRLWFEHERDCNQKVLAMLESVPKEKRSEPDFPKALAKAAHIALARKLWLHRIGELAPSTTLPTDLFPELPIEQLRPLFVEIETAWTAWLATLTDADLTRTFDYVRQGVKLRYNVELALTQLNGHAWYHRGQIGSYVARLGGEFVDTDFVFWHKPERLPDA